jgi:serine kinase of HPr protein (carbohydrate metabolism regulator)
MLVHATTMDIAGLGLLILGPSGAGKSDLALRLLARGALLVADDQTDVTPVAGRLRACGPAPISGLIEARGFGIVRAPTKRATRLRLAVELVQRVVERMPEPKTWSLPGHETPRVPLIEIEAFEASAAEKALLVLAAVPEA